MPSRQNLSVTQDNDVTVDLAVFEQDGTTPQDLTGLTLSMLIKASSTAPDSAAVATLTVGAGLTLVSAPGGTLTAFLPHTLLEAPGLQWYRVDVLDLLSNRTTAIDGLLLTNPA